MKMKRLAAFAAAASLAAMAFVSTASPAQAWDLQQCKDTWAKGEDHPDCKKYEKYKTTTTKKAETTTTKKAEATTTTVKDEVATTTAPKATTTTVAVKGEAVKPAPVKVQPKYTG